MGKHGVRDDDKPEPSSKRQKLPDGTTSVKPAPQERQEIHSAQQLRQILTFQRDGGPSLRSRIVSAFRSAYDESNSANPS